MPHVLEYLSNISTESDINNSAVERATDNSDSGASRNFTGAIG